MTISSRFAVAIHILSLLEVNKEGRNTSDFIASSVNTNPVVIRRIMSMLNKAGLVITNPGVAGAVLDRPMEQITLLEVYRAVQADHKEELFSVHENPNPQCAVGRNIQGALESTFLQAQKAMEDELSKVTLKHIVSQMIEES